MPKPGDVVVCPFAGAQGVKVRTAAVISTDLYHTTGADAVVAEITTQLWKTRQPTCFALRDWSAAGLNKPSAFRCYLAMVLKAELRTIGHLSDRDWQEAQARLRLALAVT
jgi:mRNA-degrading endonuclease toxin of MazEF toxin-antitoxin module